MYDRHGQLLANFFVEERHLVPLQDVPLHVRLAMIAAEDSRFYRHGGIDLKGILRAFWVNLRAGKTREGASTITQQLARNLFLTPERTLRRKIREALLARRLEKRYSKDRILELYVNQTFYGHTAYGVEAAAQLYFGKSAQELTLAEGALIAGVTPAPNAYSPWKNPERSLQQRAHVLQRMVTEGYLGAVEAQRAAQEPLRLRSAAIAGRINHAPYFVEHVRQYITGIYGEEALNHAGLKIYTTLDLSLQRAAVQAVQHGVLSVDKRTRSGEYEGPLRRLELTQDTVANAALIRAVTFPGERESTYRQGDIATGVVLAVRDAAVTVALKDTHGRIGPEGWRWVRQVRGLKTGPRLTPAQFLRRGDVIRVRVTHVDPADQAHGLALEPDPVVQGALVALETGSGHVLAMVGGYDFVASQFNRAVQAQRQPGSAFKPLIYAAALVAGMTPDSLVDDSPLTRTTTDGESWTPSNYDNTFWGPITLRTALAHSRNVATVRVFEQVGLERMCAFVTALGLQSPVHCYPSLALGASSVTLLDLSAVYGVFASGGLYAQPLFVTKIVDRDGTVLEAQQPTARRVMRADMARTMTQLLESVVQEGTGKAVQALQRPAAGKTGTTDSFHDAWFIGYTPEIVTGVWVGRDDATPIGPRETGARAAIPIWTTFMHTALEGKPVTAFAPGSPTPSTAMAEPQRRATQSPGAWFKRLFRTIHKDSARILPKSPRARKQRRERQWPPHRRSRAKRDRTSEQN